MSNLPLVSIIIPVKPGGKVKALAALANLDYPRDKLEIFIAEGTQPSKQRNEAVREATGEIIHFLDDDSCPDSGNIRLIVEQFRNPNVAVVGGPSIVSGSDTFLQKCFASLFTSPFGGAGIRNRYRSTGMVRDSSEKELILCNLAFRKTVFDEMGQLNEKLYPNEENELMARITNSTYRLIHHPNMIVYRSQRKTIRLFAKQILNYGRGRMEQTILYPKSFSFAHFIPPLFLFYCISLFFTCNSYYWLPMILYLLMSALFAFSSTAKNPKTFICLFVLFPIMHLSYGAGMIWGGVRYFMTKEKAPSDVVVRRIDSRTLN